MIFAAAVLAVAQSAAAPPQAAKKPLTLEKISEPAFGGPGASGFTWRDEARVTWVVSEDTGPEAPATLWEFDAKSGRKTVLFPPVSVKDRAGKERKLSARGGLWSPRGDVLLVAFDHDLWLLAPGAGPRRLTNDPDDEESPTFSPDGSRVAYVKKSDLFTLERAAGVETRLTATGGEHVFNGVLDWVYEEELARRRGRRSYEWAPDSAAIAYLCLDENRVPAFPVVDFTPVNGKVLPQRYPKSGDPNAIPSVHVVDLTGRETASFTPAPDDVYVAPELAWTADGRQVCFLLLDRPQTTLDVFLLPRLGGAPKKLLTETDPAWVNAIEPPRFLADGTFLFRSERTGFFHLYRHASDGTLVNALTAGGWMIDGPWAVDARAGLVFFTATEKDPRERHVYRAKLDGTGLMRITQERGSHSFVPSPGGGFFVSTYSNATTPPRTIVRTAAGALVGVLDDTAGSWAGYALSSVEMGSFKGSDGTLFYTRLVKPGDFDPARKYPAIVFVYGGPHAQEVQDRWTTASGLDHFLASKGFLVWTMDNRGSWGRGHAFETPIFRNMGAQELKDQLEGVAELKKKPFVDAARLGIWGWSYGGYLTLFAVTHTDGTFKCAVAGAPVTDWKFYDSIYTERYMKRPADNPKGYKASSPLEAAKNLSTKLLVMHGTADNNVHMQNSIDFLDELMKARVDFVFVPLPRQQHGPRREALLYRN
ncbi:MAG: S9 family peptidase, partial [Thermoanaerobaculia bacterium]|nr:S9 family peptidase [Thermoanaerobaculia bacterium]